MTLKFNRVRAVVKVYMFLQNFIKLSYCAKREKNSGENNTVCRYHADCNSDKVMMMTMMIEPCRLQ